MTKPDLMTPDMMFWGLKTLEKHVPLKACEKARQTIKAMPTANVSFIRMGHTKKGFQYLGGALSSKGDHWVRLDVKSLKVFADDNGKLGEQINV